MDIVLNAQPREPVTTRLTHRSRETATVSMTEKYVPPHARSAGGAEAGARSAGLGSGQTAVGEEEEEVERQLSRRDDDFRFLLRFAAKLLVLLRFQLRRIFFALSLFLLRSSVACLSHRSSSPFIVTRKKKYMPLSKTKRCQFGSQSGIDSKPLSTR